MEQVRNKINWISILQGWAMLWVVVGHAPLGVAGEGAVWENLLYRFAYSFHMPLFMLLSGYLFNLTRLSMVSSDGKTLWPYSAILRDKALRLLIPMVVFTFLAFFAKNALPSEMDRVAGLGINDFVMAFLCPSEGPLNEMWFIATLFWMFVFTPVWKWCLQKKWTTWGMFAVLLLLHFLHPDVKLLCVGDMCSYAFYFYCGVVLFRSAHDGLDSGSGKWWLLLAGAVTYALGLAITPFVTTVGGIIFSIAVALILDKYLPAAFSSFRNYTYQIFLMGIFVQILVKIIYRHTSVPYSIAFLSSTLAGLYVPVFISRILKRINFKPLLYCVGMK